VSTLDRLLAWAADPAAVLVEPPPEAAAGAVVDDEPLSYPQCLRLQQFLSRLSQTPPVGPLTPPPDSLPPA